MHTAGRVTLRLYNFCVTIPDRLYPFSEMVEGKKVRWRRAYNQAVERMNEIGGYGHYGARLIAYRSVFHIIGSFLFIVFATLVSQKLFGNEKALYILLGMAAFALVYQEFFLQPKTFGQMKIHSTIDVLSWLVPFGIFLYLHLA